MVALSHFCSSHQVSLTAEHEGSAALAPCGRPSARPARDKDTLRFRRVKDIKRSQLPRSSRMRSPSSTRSSGFVPAERSVAAPATVLAQSVIHRCGDCSWQNSTVFSASSKSAPAPKYGMPAGFSSASVPPRRSPSVFCAILQNSDTAAGFSEVRLRASGAVSRLRLFVAAGASAQSRLKGARPRSPKPSGGLAHRRRFALRRLRRCAAGRLRPDKNL